MIIDALRDKYSLSQLIGKLGISKSSYCYQHNVKQLQCKYKDIKAKVIELFEENKQRYGYRRINALLRKENIIVSEKIVRKIMKDNSLTVQVRRRRKYSSYQGEISEPAENVINRDFHSGKPNDKVLTDITEFSIPAGKVYLSPIVDCFDGMIPSWTVSTSPNADLVNECWTIIIRNLRAMKNRQFIPIGAPTTDGLAGLIEWMSMDIPEACRRKAVRRIIQHAKDFSAG